MSANDDLYDPHVSSLKRSDHQKLGAFLAGEGVLTLQEVRDIWMQLGYEATHDGGGLPSETPLMVSIFNRPNPQFRRPNGPIVPEVHQDEVPLIIDAHADADEVKEVRDA